VRLVKEAGAIVSAYLKHILNKYFLLNPYYYSSSSYHFSPLNVSIVFGLPISIFVSISTHYLHCSSNVLLRILIWGKIFCSVHIICSLKLFHGSQALVAHACNPTYPGGRDQEDHGLKPAWANSSWDPVSKIPNIKKGWWSGSKCRPWVQVPVLQKRTRHEMVTQAYWCQSSSLRKKIMWQR
jgi:hypothetical protein